MSGAETEHRTAETPGPAAPEASGRPCPRCAAPLAAGQDWCLSCGAPASTRIAPPPSWRAPLAIVAGVLVVAIAALTVAFLSLTDDAERVAQAPEPTPTAQPAETATPAPVEEQTPEPLPGEETPAPGPGTVESWPEGETAWTVIVLSTEDEAGARGRAQELAAGGTQVGVLNSSDYGSLRPGFWVVFSGRYETSEEAQAAAAGLTGTAPGAYARFVEP